MGVGVERRGDERSVRRDDRVITGLDRDFNPIVTPTETHLPFGHFQSRVMGARNELEYCAHNDGLSFRRRKYKWPPRRLFLQRRLNRPVLQLQATFLFG